MGPYNCYITSKKFDELKEDDIAGFKILYHYLLHKAFLEEGELLTNISRLENIPVIIIQGRYDMVCPFETAWEIHHKLPQSKLIVVPNAGHLSSEPGIIHETITWTDKLSK
ncbi:MAG TPA: alpha/beta hydrolase [Candidatus Nitrosocosmicus sp.]|nr:alpha/beta hydrolase [Candidatus Nitrosocosmicus sp.]